MLETPEDTFCHVVAHLVTLLCLASHRTNNKTKLSSLGNNRRFHLTYMGLKQCLYLKIRYKN